MAQWGGWNGSTNPRKMDATDRLLWSHMPRGMRNCIIRERIGKTKSSIALATPLAKRKSSPRKSSSKNSSR
jgi:hypothetical protein